MLSYAYAGIDAASWNDRVVGAALVAAAVIRIVTPVDITVLGLLIAGLGGWWLVAAPFVFSYDGAPRATASDLAVGGVVILLAVAGLVLRRRSARARYLLVHARGPRGAHRRRLFDIPEPLNNPASRTR